MEEIKTPIQAEELARHAIENAVRQEEKQKGLFEDLMKEVESINPELGGYEELAMLLNLEEEHFKILGPIFLSEIEKSYNNVTDKLAFAQAMNVAGLRIEDMQEQYHTLCEKIDEDMIMILSRQKRNFLKQLLGLTYNAISDTVGVNKRIVTIPIEYCREGVKTPTYANTTDAGLDVYAIEDITIAPGETKLIPVGFKVAIPFGYELQVRPKSGRCLRSKLRIANTPGTIDSGYRDEVGVIIDNIEPFIKSADIDENGRLFNVLFGQSYTIGKGEKFAQLVLNEVPKVTFYETDNIGEIGEDRGGGFGSTGLTDSTPVKK